MTKVVLAPMIHMLLKVGFIVTAFSVVLGFN